MATNRTDVTRGYVTIPSLTNEKQIIQMYYETIGEGEPVIFLHQCMWNSFEFERVLPIVAAAGFKCYAPDHLGFGYSTPAPRGMELTDFTQAVIDFMDGLGIQKASFCGQHSGSLVMADIAARFPERVDKLIFGGLAIYGDEIRKDKRARRDQIGAFTMAITRNLKPGEVVGPENGFLQRKEDGSHMAAMFLEQLNENPDSKFEYVQRAAMANMMHFDKGGSCLMTALYAWDMKKVLPFVKQPSLQLVGSMDCVKPPVFETVDHAASRLGSKINKIKVIEHAGIMGWLDYPWEFAQEVIAFLRDPEGYVGTTGWALHRYMKETMFPVEEILNYEEHVVYPEGADEIEVEPFTTDNVL